MGEYEEIQKLIIMLWQEANAHGQFIDEDFFGGIEVVYELIERMKSKVIDRKEVIDILETGRDRERMERCWGWDKVVIDG